MAYLKSELALNGHLAKPALAPYKFQYTEYMAGELIASTGGQALALALLTGPVLLVVKNLDLSNKVVVTYYTIAADTDAQNVTLHPGEFMAIPDANPSQGNFTFTATGEECPVQYALFQGSP